MFVTLSNTFINFSRLPYLIHFVGQVPWTTLSDFFHHYPNLKNLTNYGSRPCERFGESCEVITGVITQLADFALDIWFWAFLNVSCKFLLYRNSCSVSMTYWCRYQLQPDPYELRVGKHRGSGRGYCTGFWCCEILAVSAALLWFQGLRSTSTNESRLAHGNYSRSSRLSFFLYDIPGCA